MNQHQSTSLDAIHRGSRKNPTTCSDEMSSETGVNYNRTARHDCTRCFRFAMHLGVAELGLELSLESDLTVFSLIPNPLSSTTLPMSELPNKSFEDQDSRCWTRRLPLPGPCQRSRRSEEVRGGGLRHGTLPELHRKVYCQSPQIRCVWTPWRRKSSPSSAVCVQVDQSSLVVDDPCHG